MPIGNIVISSGNSRRRCGLNDLSTFRSRHRNPSDLRYPGSSDLSSYTSSTYSDRYNHGYQHDYSRDPYASYPSLRNPDLYPDAGSMSKYTRSYDITNRNYDNTTSSPRFFDRDKFDKPGDVAPFEFGVHYTRSPDVSTKTHDVIGRSYDRSTNIDDVTTRRSPARSLSDRAAGARHSLEAPIDRSPVDRGPTPTERGPPGERPSERIRQRVNSGDSASSHSSDRSTGQEDRSLFNALKHRYKESAEKQYDDTSMRAPFSSWRRSGNFEDATAASSLQDHHRDKVALEGQSSRMGNERDSWKRDSYKEGQGSRSSQPGGKSEVKIAGAAGDEQSGDLSTDDLIFNFRQALRRHALSESERAGESKTPSSVGQSPATIVEKPSESSEDDPAAQKLERLRAARARIAEQRKSEKVGSQAFATEFKVEKQQEKPEKSKLSHYGSASSASQKFETEKEIETKLDDQKHRQSTKLGRQKLVSDDHKTKFMEARKDETEKDKDTKHFSDDSVNKKRNSRKEKHSEHLENQSKDKQIDKDQKVSDHKTKAESESVPSMEEMLLGSTRHSRPSSMAKKFERVDHSSPFGSVYTAKPAPQAVSKPAEIKQETVDKVETKVEDIIETPKAKVMGKTERKYKKYAKAKSLELGALSNKTREKSPDENFKDNSTPLANINFEELSQMSRQERIVKYKEDRKKQLEAMQKRFAGEQSELPSLFLSSKSPSRDTDSQVARSKSMKVGSEKKSDASSVSRSKSYKEEKDTSSDFSEASGHNVRDVPKMSGLRLAELGAQVKHDKHENEIYDTDDKRYKPESVIDKIHAIRDLKIGQHDQALSSREQSPVRTDSSLERDVVSQGTYTSRTALAERAMGGHYKGRESPSRDRSDLRYKPSESPRYGFTDKTRDGNASDSSEASSIALKSRIFSDKDEGTMSKAKEPERKSYFEFGTVFSKKEPPKKDTETSASQVKELKMAEEVSKAPEVERVISDSLTRARRKLPSVEDVLGTGKAEQMDSFKDVERKEFDVVYESDSSVKSGLSREDIEQLTAKQIQSSKIKSNIEKAKSRFKDEDKSSVVDPSRFELGTVYTGKKESKSMQESSKDKSVSYKHTKPTMQDMLGVNREPTENIASESESIKTTAKQTVSTVRDETKNQIEERDKKRTEDKTVTKPPSSPRSDRKIATLSPRVERKKASEQKFGKVSYRSDDQKPFEFGTSYIKKETTVPPKSQVKATESKIIESEKEATQSVVPDQKINDLGVKVDSVRSTNTSSIQLKSPKSIDKDDKSQSLEKQRILESPVKSKSETPFTFDIKAKSLLTATGKQTEMPQSPKQSSIISPTKTVTEPMKIVSSSSTVVSSTARGVSPVRKFEPAKIVVTSSSNVTPTTKALPIITSTVASPKAMSVKTESTSSIMPLTSIDVKKDSPKQEKLIATTEQKQPERQKSSGVFEIKTSTKVVEKNVEERPKVETSSKTVTSQYVKTVDRAETHSEIKPYHQKTSDTKVTEQIMKKPVETRKQISDDNESMKRKDSIDKDSESRKHEEKDLAKEEDKHEKSEHHEPKPRRERVRTEPELSKFEMMKRSVAAKVLIKPQPIEPYEEEEHKERSKKTEKVKPVKKRDERSRRERNEKAKAMTKLKSGSVMDTSLDDILSRNVDYLSDIEPPEQPRGRGLDKKSRPMSVHEHHKTKRTFKKKVDSRRSKSEDRSHFKVEYSDEDEEEDEAPRSKVTEDIPVGKVKVKRLLPLGHGTQLLSDEHNESFNIQRKSSSSSSSSATAATAGGYHTRANHPDDVDQTGKPVSEELEKADKHSGDSDQTGFIESTRLAEQNKNQSGRWRDSASVSEFFYSDPIQQEALDSVSELSHSEIASGVTSDTSEMSDRRRFISRGEEGPRVSDSDQSVTSSSVASDGGRKRRKDKSSMRKSKLNESADDASLSSRRADSASDDSLHTARVGVRRVSSSRLARENRTDSRSSQDKEVNAVLQRHDLAHSLRLNHLNQSARDNNNQSADKPLDNSDHSKHLSHPDSPRLGNKSVIDSVLPSRFALPSKVSTAISRLCEASEKEVAPVAKKPEEASRPIRRGNNFSQLLQKFSSSEASGSEKSDSESPRARKVLLKRQEACSLSSSSSESTRRTPERTQSLKLRNQPELTPQQNMDNSVQRSSSFRSSFMQRRFSPEPDERRRLPATPVSQEQQDDKPSPELAKVLNKRSEIVTKQQEASEDVDRRKIHDGRVEHADRFSAARDDEVIADKEVLQMLRNRRKETDSSLSVSDSDSKSHTDTNKSAKQSKSVLNKTEAISDISKTPKSAISRRLNSQSSEERQKYRSEKLKTAVTGAKYSEKSQVPRLDLTSIDTSLNVLKTVTDDLEARDEVKAKTSVQGGKFTSELSHINVTSPTQVVQFIKSVEKDNQDSSVNTSEPSKGNDTEKIEVFSVPKQEIIVKSSSIEVESKNTANQQRGAININNKSEIMRKISTRDRTPERQVQKRTGPMKVMSPLNTEGTKTGLTRTESMGRTESERPKGILKRTPSLKTTGSMHVDPELAEVLRSRREQQEGVAEEDDDGLKLTAEEEIRKAREEAQDAESTPERELSVAERVFQMHNKIEEVRSCPITPRAFSGFSTPKALLQRSGTITPKNQSSIDEENQNKSSLSGPQLIERLSSLEGRQSDLAEKRSRFQQRRRRDDCRTRTQPVTLQEIQICDSLETVIKFRSEVIQKSSINVFESLQHPESKAVPLKKTEFPQHVPPRDRRSRNQRHKTLPVTAAELGAIPEGQVSETMNSLKKKFENFGAGRDSKADSGILSGSEVDHLERESESWRSLSVEENIGEDDPVKLSVSAKASLFHTKIEESVKKPSASGAKRYIDRKKRERSRTLPITEDEVKLAAEIADNEEKEEQEKKAAESGIVALATEEGNEQTDELVRQSLADKVKLFTTIEEEKKEAARKKGVLPPPRRKNRKQASRFATQPVTYEEVEKAAKISPLACSLVKPPDPEILSGLSVKAQRDLIAQHAAQTLSQPSSRAGSRTPSRATSISDLSGEIIQQDTLTASNTDQNRNFNAIDTGASPDSVKPSSVKTRGFEPVKSEESIKTPEKEKITTSLLDSSKKNVLKSQLEEKLSLFHRKPGGDSVMSVSDINKALKKAPPPDEEVSVSEEAEQVVVTVETVEVKSILKKEGSFETRKMDTVISQISSAIGPRKEASPVTESEENTTEGVESSGDNLDSDDAILDGTSARVYKDTPNRRSSKSRRRFNRDRNLEQERYKTQPSETSGSVDETEASHVKKKYMGRHFTQPVTPDEKKNAEIITDMPEVQKSGSIHDRLNALKKSGDEEWKKRVSRPLELDKLDRRSTSPETPVAIVKMREKTGSGVPRPSSIADRLSSLTGSQDGWRDRVGETDVKKFTVEHKLSSSGQTVNESPLVSRLRGKGLRKELSKDSDPGSPGLLSPSSPTKPTPREVTCPDLPPELIAPEETHSPLARIPSQEEDDKSGTSVMVPTIGDEVDKFFLKSDDVQGPREALNVSVDDFNELFLEANDMLESTRRVKPKRRHNPKSRNPLRTMSANLEVRSEYTEIITGVAERELKSVKVAAIQQNSGFAVEALAGLASKENFSKVELRKTDSNGSTTAGNVRMDPYLPIMLLHIKGRRKVQCRLVEPNASSINSGDCFVLVTSDRIIQWIGDYCNVIEKAKAADVCDFIKQKRDMGCKSAREVTTIEEKRGNLGNARHFWEIIGGHKPYMSCGPTEEDELYENHIVGTNMVYQLEGTRLVPMEEYWGNPPKYEMLTPDQVYVFDFGTELYLWQGKSATPNQRKISVKLAQQLWTQGYDYTSCEINPLSPLIDEDEGGLPRKADSRPDWALFGKVNQNMETILFREKFSDWPDTSRFIKVKGPEEVNPTKFDLADLKPYDAKEMVAVNTSPVSLMLEGSHVGRGDKWEQDMEGFMREVCIETLKVRVWHVLEYDHSESEPHSFGQFHEGDTYVIRWQYMIVNAGMKNLKGQASKFSTAGRERCAYFFWQGKSSTINEKGASALMTVELDEERGPQVRVTEGKEPACFLNLFKGRMMIHIGKREEEDTNTQGPWRMYCIRNEYENEMCLIEIPKEINNLRSVSSCLFLNVVTGALTVWHGCKSPEHVRILAGKAAKNLQERCPMEVGLHEGVKISISEVDEGRERLNFWRMLNVHMDDRSKYHCLMDNPESFSHTLRLFHMTSVSGVFEAHEIMNPSRAPDLPTRFPMLQTDLYTAQQPALFLVDNGHEVFLWQGWWPEGDEDVENVHTGSAQTRFSVDRRCAMETTLEYCKEIDSTNPPPAYLVYGGLEPLAFTNLFPFWTVAENVREINLRLAIDQDCNLKIKHQDGRTEGELILVANELKKITKTRYTFQELLETPLPEGVDPLKLESYLSDEEFESVLDMTRDEFYALPAWKQSKMKQQCGLY
ncbi:uncharacterized protein LOC128240559 isoform X3 [Mya arenaria]|uniref:uncharacterized protein LOC128240559 isoform X3 n=1 Tax=Mya arenaria TaxID=6604 RepID=UPI0022E6E432|nr:uncharacterized protein LOC128240559 isoform X3 [Mya arenaria]